MSVRAKEDIHSIINSQNTATLLSRAIQNEYNMLVDITAEVCTFCYDVILCMIARHLRLHCVPKGNSKQTIIFYEHWYNSGNSLNNFCWWSLCEVGTALWNYIHMWSESTIWSDWKWEYFQHSPIDRVKWFWFLKMPTENICIGL